MYGLINSGLRDLLGLQTGVKPSRRKRLSRRFRQRIYWRDKGRCVFCERQVKFADATMDHFNPLVGRGAARLKENIVLSCRSCNQKKGPLTQEVPDKDLTPDSLAYKFWLTARDTRDRKGSYCDWITAHDTVV